MAFIIMLCTYANKCEPKWHFTKLAFWRSLRHYSAVCYPWLIKKFNSLGRYGSFLLPECEWSPMSPNSTNHQFVHTLIQHTKQRVLYATNFTKYIQQFCMSHINTSSLTMALQYYVVPWIILLMAQVLKGIEQCSIPSLISYMN